MTGLFGLVGAQWLRTQAVAVGMAVFLTLIAALGTSEFAFVQRLAFWLVLMVGGTAIAQMAGALLERLTSLNTWQEFVAMLALIVPPITLLVWLVTAGFNGRRPDPAQLPAYILPVAIISLAMASLHVMVNRTPAQSHVFASPQKNVAPGEALRDRLPFKFRAADIHAVSGEDHYLRVHTSAGETLVLMRLYDAISLLDGIEGSQVHRSWWVAKDAVTDIRRNDGRITLVVKGDITAPVSRTFHKALKADGWF